MQIRKTPTHAPAAPRPTVIIYSRPGCHLCDVAKKIIDACRPEREFDVVVHDISLDAELTARYGNDVPVICVNGREIARHFVRKDEFLRALDVVISEPPR
jgi:glutaredoxin